MRCASRIVACSSSARGTERLARPQLPLPLQGQAVPPTVGAARADGLHPDRIAEKVLFAFEYCVLDLALAAVLGLLLAVEAFCGLFILVPGMKIVPVMQGNALANQFPDERRSFSTVLVTCVLQAVASSFYAGAVWLNRSAERVREGGATGFIMLFGLLLILRVMLAVVGLASGREGKR